MENIGEPTVRISLTEYKKLKENSEVDRELLRDIATGIKDILNGEIEEI